MTKSVEHRSVFDLGPNDEVLVGLVKVRSALQTPCNTAAAPAGLSASQLYILKGATTLVTHILMSVLTLNFTQMWTRCNMKNYGNPAC